MHTDVGWRRMTEEALVSHITRLVPTLTFFCERWSRLDAKSGSMRFLRGFTHKECRNFGHFWPQFVRDDLQGHALGAGFDALIDED